MSSSTTNKTTTKVLCIDSLFRDHYEKTESTNYLYKLIEPVNNVMSMTLSSIELPNNWYMFSKENYTNKFIVTCYNVPVSVLDETIRYTEIVHEIEIPDGNYVADTFQTALTNLFKNTGHGLEYIGIKVNTKNACTEFFTGIGNTIDDYPFSPYTATSIEKDPNDIFYFKIDFRLKEINTSYKSIGWNMGFRKSQYLIQFQPENINNRRIIENNQYYWGYLQSESSFGSTYDQYLFLEIDDFQRNVCPSTVISSVGDANLRNNIMGKIIISSGQFTNIIDNGTNRIFKKREYFGPIRLERMRLRLINRFGDVVKLNDNNYSITLELECCATARTPA